VARCATYRTPGSCSELIVPMSGESCRNRVANGLGVCAKPLHLGQHPCFCAACPNSLGNHLKSAAPHVDGNHVSLVGRDPEGAGVAAEEPPDS
jgi:hypothetical protein